MTYLFSKTGFSALHNFIDPLTLLAFDFDGTLAPIAADPGGVRVSRRVREELAGLMRLTKVAVLTGRARADAQAHLGIDPHFLIGNHGAEGLPGQDTREADFLKVSDGWERQLRGLLSPADNDGVVVENKGATISVHYRASKNRAAARSRVLRSIELLVPRPRRISGKCVENLVPLAAPNKGDALLYLMKHARCPKGFYVGDDETDEDVFRLKGNQILTARVGAARQSQARYALRDQHEITRLLREIVAILALSE